MLLRIAAWGLVALLLVGLFGRIMTYPLSHDEQIHVSAARLIFHEPLYGVVGYNHLPGLPLLLGGIYAMTGTTSLLLAGRLLIFGCWLATASVLWLIVRHYRGGPAMLLVAMLVLGAGTLLGPAGMVTTNNFLPVPFALLGAHCIIVGLDGGRVRPWLIFFAGCAVGAAILLKISYVMLLPPVVIAAMIEPRGLPLVDRIRLVLLPLLAGGMLGGLPILVVGASDPQMLLAHTVRYFTGGHLAYWEHSTEPKIMSFRDKLALAGSVWLLSSGLLSSVLALGFAWLVGRRDPARLRRWPILFLIAIIGIAALLSFVPTPAFPQYYEPPVPFVLLLAIMLYGEVEEPTRRRLWPLMAGVSVLALGLIAPRFLPHMTAIAHPSRWTGTRIHAEGERIRAELAARGERGKVLTLQPILPLEGRLPLYREFGAGPFIYRVADYIAPADRRFFTTTSPGALSAFLDADPPAAIVTGREAALDPAFVAYARSRGYAEVMTGNPRMQLFIRPVTRLAPIAPTL
ncbi:glycosyltransferase family 39 protein [Sphingomonas sp. PR090111-T3T-6A]|uniref:glycosyltransferase family 39 protein n=1 Tax=Sphingomonas sp. PR090111-T3T-6A TaxID=685778 RepID=UPI00037C678E|nr:glycosyltransferase family 39 protein [Sphingomonas sp. PR090111-T3T-6A]